MAAPSWARRPRRSPPAALAAAHDHWSAAAVDERRRYKLAISSAYLLAYFGRAEAALAELDAVERRFPDFDTPSEADSVARLSRARRQIKAGFVRPVARISAAAPRVGRAKEQNMASSEQQGAGRLTAAEIDPPSQIVYEKLSIENRPLPQALTEHPSMMSAHEVGGIYNLAARWASGAGAIVDAGPFLGSSTRAMGYGLRENPNLPALVQRLEKPVRSYELGQARANIEPHLERHGLDRSLVQDGSFLPLLKSLTADVAELVELNEGDVTSFPWIGGAVEILFLDLLKAPFINTSCLEKWFPYLLPETGIVIQQDYFFEQLVFLRISQEALDPYFEYCGNLGSSAYFRLLKPIPINVIEQAARPSEMPIERRLELVDQAAARVTHSPLRVFFTSMSKIELVREGLSADQGMRIYEQIHDEFPHFWVKEGPFSNRLRTARDHAEKVLTTAFKAEGRAAPAFPALT